jgi:hypothetical protein
LTSVSNFYFAFINTCLYIQIHHLFIGPHNLLSTAASCLAISLLSVEDSAPYVATGLIHFYFFCSEY